MNGPATLAMVIPAEYGTPAHNRVSRAGIGRNTTSHSGDWATRTAQTAISITPNNQTLSRE